MKPILLFVQLTLISTFCHADAIKYRQPNGQIVITNQVNDGYGKPISRQQDEYVSSESYQRAQEDLRRQRAFIQSRERQNAASNMTYTPTVVASGFDYSAVQQCLGRVTATTGLSPTQEAARKVNCYGGTHGLNDECQRSVAATMRLSSRDEQYYKSVCPH